ncbi:MAG: Tic20 family protein [Chroococcales cyanobacterium]
MTWRGSADVKDRIFGALVYLLPLVYALPFGAFLFRQFPVLELIKVPLIPLLIVYRFPFAGIIIFFVLFLAVVRNERISHFIRFNTLQAILLDILLFLLTFLMQIIGRGLNSALLTQTLFNVIFLGTLAACVYGIVQSALGRYAEIPAVSEAVYSQVP